MYKYAIYCKQSINKCCQNKNIPSSPNVWPVLRKDGCPMLWGEDGRTVVAKTQAHECPTWIWISVIPFYSNCQVGVVLHWGVSLIINEHVGYLKQVLRSPWMLQSVLLDWILSKASFVPADSDPFYFYARQKRDCLYFVARHYFSSAILYL